MVSLTVYGGVAGDERTGQIGGNKILLEWDDKAYFLDFGTNFGLNSRYYDEFLNPRTAVGLRDFLRMGLVPPLEGILRHDLYQHEPDIWDRYRSHPHYRRIDHVDGVLLSHAHQDHNGYLGFLEPEIPVYTGLMTALIGKGMQDIGGSGPDAEFSYIAPRKLTDEGTLKGVTGRRIGRPHYICESQDNIVQALEQLKSFFAQHPGKRTDFRPAPVETADLEALGLRFFRVDHSIPGSGAFAVDTPIGWVAYTGDLRHHGHSKWRTDLFVEELAKLKPSVLICEGTNLNEGEPIDEPTVQDAARDVVKAEPGIVIADFSPRNIERLRSFHDIAEAVGRKLVITTKDAYLLEQMHVIDPDIPDPGQSEMAVLREPHASHRSWEDDIFERFGANVVDAETIRRRQGDYLLCLSFWNISNLIDIEPNGGTYIYSSSEAYDEEQVIDHRRLRHWLEYFGLKIVGGLPGADLEGPFHASGHIDAASMEWLIETVKPEKIVPVHSKKVGWFEERWGDKVVTTALGNRLELDA